MVSKIYLKYRLIYAILFGPYTKGIWNYESDVDIFLITKDMNENLNKYKQELVKLENEIILKYDILISSIIVSDINFQNKKSFIPLYKNIMEETKILYGRI